MNVTKMSLQAVFNRVAKHLINQSKRAYDKKSGLCVCYDPKTGRRCAVGCLMPVSFYRGGNGSINLQDLWDKIGIDCSDKGHNYKEFLQSLQIIHDYDKPSRWQQKLRSFARENDLKIPYFLLQRNFK